MKAKIHDVNKVFWKHVRPHLGLASVIVLGISFAKVTQIVTPIFYKRFFDVLTGDVEPFRGSIPETLVYIILIVLAINFVGNILWRVAGLANAKFQPLMMRNLERSSYDYLMGHSYRFFTNNFTGALVRKIRRLSRSFERIADQLTWHFLSVALSITGTVIVVWQRSTLIALGIVLWVVAFVVLNIFFSIWKLRYDEKRAKADSEVTAVLADGITNSSTVKLFAGHGKEMHMFRHASEAFKKLQTFTWSLNEINMFIQGLLFVILEFGIMFYAINLWQQGLLTIGDFALLQAYISMMFGQVWEIGRYIRDTYEAYADAKEMVEILKEPHEVVDAKTAKELKVTQGAVEFQDVDFRYAQTRKVLDKLNLKIKPKEKVALVGPSGAGKSTIVKLLFRFFDIQRGKIFIDGQRLTRVTQESLRNQIGLVPQEAILFHRSLMDNIRYGREDATDEEVVEAAKKARCHEFIMGLPNQYETFVGERGVKLSGGERQRVAIARAILKNAPILVLDEATSSLDSESEALIQEALEELMSDATTIVIAHRLSTIMKMDRIIVMESGKVVDTGSHKLLSRKKGIYKKLWNIQAGGYS